MIDRPFLRHWLESADAQQQILGSAVTGTISNLSLSQVGNLKIPLPPLPEQRRIAEVLDKVEVLRAKRRDSIAAIDGLTQSIFLEMFGDPFDKSLKWPTLTVGETVTHLVYGPRFYNEIYTSDGIRIVRITDLNASGELDFNAMPRMSVSSKEIEQHSLKEGDILFARSGSVGKIALINKNSPPCIAGAYFIVLRFDSKIMPLFARTALSSPSMQEHILSRSRQAIQPNFSGPGLRSLPMPIPPLSLQQLFTRRIAAVEKLKAVHCTSLAQLDALFASLQYRAFRGEL